MRLYLVLIQFLFHTRSIVLFTPFLPHMHFYIYNLSTTSRPVGSHNLFFPMRFSSLTWWWLHRAAETCRHFTQQQQNVVYQRVFLFTLSYFSHNGHVTTHDCIELFAHVFPKRLIIRRALLIRTGNICIGKHGLHYVMNSKTSNCISSLTLEMQHHRHLKFGWNTFRFNVNGHLWSHMCADVDKRSWILSESAKFLRIFLSIGWTVAFSELQSSPVKCHFSNAEYFTTRSMESGRTTGRRSGDNLTNAR